VTTDQTNGDRTTQEDVIVEAKGLTKYYGSFPAIEDVSFTARRGEVLGFLGPNAAGKTTTMRIVTGYMPPTTGTVLVDGYDILGDSLEVRKRIGYLPESVPLYTDMTVREYLSFMGALRGMEKKRIIARIPEVVELCHLEDYIDSHISKLSKGFRQRTGIAQAIIHEPELLILDEPTVGIDPIQVVDTRNLIRGLGGDRTVILSTHILSEASQICDRVLIIYEGQIVAEDEPENLAQRLQNVERVEMEVQGPVEQVARTLENVTGVENVTWVGSGNLGTFTVDVKLGQDLRSRLARTIVSQDWGLLQLNVISMSLEEIFLSLTAQEESNQ
jgi:ABC-2 type transport system ATP-binding protein